MRRCRPAFKAFAPLVVLALTTGCGKTNDEPPRIAWRHDFDTARAFAVAQDKPLLVFVRASWDCGSKEYDHATFTDREVRTRLANDFVAVYVDASDDENAETRRLSQKLNVVGIPTVVMLAPDDTELRRFDEYLGPRSFAEALRSAKETADHRGKSRDRSSENACPSRMPSKRSSCS